jgi:hypothetical protein
MLEIIFIIWLSKLFGDWASDKGYRRGLFRGLSIAAWGTGEMTAALAASLFTDELMLIVILALGGALAGIGIFAIVLATLPQKFGAAVAAKDNPIRVAEATWTCPKCSLQNSGWRHTCFRCSYERTSAEAPSTRAPGAQTAPDKDKQWTCPVCGHINLASDRYCYSCKHEN